MTITLYPLETDSTALLKYIQQEIKRWTSLKPSRFQEIIDGVKEKGNGNFNENSPDHYKRLVKHLFIDLAMMAKERTHSLKEVLLMLSMQMFALIAIGSLSKMYMGKMAKK